MNPNMSSNMMTTGGQPMCSSTTQSFIPSSQSMAPIVSQNPSMAQQMESAITSTSNPMVPQNQQYGQSPVGQPPVASTMAPMNIAYLCRVGDETVIEIVTKTCELFSTLRQMSPPTGSQPAVTQDRQMRTKDMLKNIEFLFKRLRKSYEKCNECLVSIDYINIESIIPMKDQDFHKVEDKKSTNIKVKQLDKEHKDLTELLLLKNRQIKEIIDNLRAIVWEINTMLAMRKP